MHTGQIIKLVRTIDGIAQGDAARKLRVTTGYLSQVENGRKKPGLDLLKNFSKEFDVPLPLLFLSAEDLGEGNEIVSELRKLLTELIVARAAQM
jgi:transcriptional regulator with XRE-family HTH domain